MCVYLRRSGMRKDREGVLAEDLVGDLLRGSNSPMQMPMIEITTRPPVTPSSSSSAVRQLQWSCLHEDGRSLVVHEIEIVEGRFPAVGLL